MLEPVRDLIPGGFVDSIWIAWALLAALVFPLLAWQFSKSFTVAARALGLLTIAVAICELVRASGSGLAMGSLLASLVFGPALFLMWAACPSGSRGQAVCRSMAVCLTMCLGETPLLIADFGEFWEMDIIVAQYFMLLGVIWLPLFRSIHPSRALPRLLMTCALLPLSMIMLLEFLSDWFPIWLPWAWELLFFPATVLLIPIWLLANVALKPGLLNQDSEPQGVV